MSTVEIKLRAFAAVIDMTAPKVSSPVGGTVEAEISIHFGGYGA